MVIKHILNYINNNTGKSINDIFNLSNTMLTVKKKDLIDSINNKIIKENEKNTIIKEDIKIEFGTECELKKIKDNYFLPKQKDTLFWCIYILKYGNNKYYDLINYGNTELDEKTKCLEFIENNKILLKSCCNYKLTFINLKEIKSELITEQIKTSFYALLAFVCFYKMNIYIIHESRKMYLKFTNEENKINHILLKDNKKFKIMHSNIDNNEINKFIVNKYCLEHFEKPIKGVSNYKVSELEEIAKIFNIDTSGKIKTDLFKCIQLELIWD